MPGCVLRVTGPAQAVGDAVREACVSFTEALGSMRARERGESDHATFNFTVSQAPGTEVPRQVQEVEDFVRRHRTSLSDLLGKPGVHRAVLDFGCEVASESCGTWVRWPASLLALCGELGLDVELSIYVDASGEEQA